MIFNKKYKIVYVEDDTDMVHLMRVILEQNHFIVYTAKDGQDGLSLISQVEPDLILLDLMMPDLDGWEIFQRIRNIDSFKKTPVIIVTAKSQEIDKVLGLRIAKVDDYICKPFHPKDLVERINDVLAG
ncbi:MAG: response regulator [Anaerolineaceae bacterium]|nr:response regulator [Anaerolineaceae bacterium]